MGDHRVPRPNKMRGVARVDDRRAINGMLCAFGPAPGGKRQSTIARVPSTTVS